jgi:ABC-type polysaccharide/polyol phosphate transport system ATPase subunit
MEAARALFSKSWPGLQDLRKVELKSMEGVASILEIGSGFHPELTGLENIHLNGSILGFSKKEITPQVDSIIEFSGIKDFINEPVKNYSSGMYVRLASVSWRICLLKCICWMR